MTNRNRASAAPEQDRIADAVDRLTQRIQVVDDTLTDILHEVKWVLQNHVNVRMIDQMPADPADQEWASKLSQMNPSNSSSSIPESLACSECDADSPPSLAAALQEGWSDLIRDDGPMWNYLGICPACQAELIHEEPVVQESKQKAHRKPAQAATLW